MTDRIEKEIEIAAPVSRVWQALTDHRQFSEWFRINLESPFAVGQPTAGRLVYPGYEHLRLEVVTTAIQPETYFAYTWHPHAIDSKADYSQETPTLVEFHLQPTKTGTLLKLTESGFDKIPAARRDEAFRGNTNGWAQQLENIRNYVHKAS